MFYWRNMSSDPVIKNEPKYKAPCALFSDIILSHVDCVFSLILYNLKIELINLSKLRVLSF